LRVISALTMILGLLFVITNEAGMLTNLTVNHILDAIGQDDMYYYGFSCKLFIKSILDLLMYYRWNNVRPNVC